MQSITHTHRWCLSKAHTSSASVFCMPFGSRFSFALTLAAICLLASLARSATQCSVPRLFVALALLSRGAIAASEGNGQGSREQQDESWTQTFHGWCFYVSSTESTEPRKNRMCFRKATASASHRCRSGAFGRQPMLAKRRRSCAGIHQQIHQCGSKNQYFV